MNYGISDVHTLCNTNMFRYVNGSPRKVWDERIWNTQSETTSIILTAANYGRLCIMPGWDCNVIIYRLNECTRARELDIGGIRISFASQNESIILPSFRTCLSVATFSSVFGDFACVVGRSRRFDKSLELYGKTFRSCWRMPCMKRSIYVVTNNI